MQIVNMYFVFFGEVTVIVRRAILDSTRDTPAGQPTDLRAYSGVVSQATRHRQTPASATPAPPEHSRFP